MTNKMRYMSEGMFLAVLLRLLVLPDWPTAFGFLVVALNYAHKRYVMDKERAFEFVSLERRLEQLSDINAGIIKDLAQVREEQLEVKKIAEESKRLISHANIGLGFRPPQRKEKI